MGTQFVTQPVSWRAFTDNGIEAHVALDREPFIDRRNSGLVLRVGDGATPGGIPLVTGSAGYTAVPAILSPLDGSVNVFTQIVINSSAFAGVDDNGDSIGQTGAYWEISSASDFSIPVYQSGLSATNLVSLDLEAEGITLANEQIHYVRVKHVGANLITSEWSDAVSFTTRTIELIGMELTKLHASDGADIDNFGGAVALSGDGSIALISAYNDDDNGIQDSGSVYVLTQAGGIWTEQQKLHASDPAVDDGFGISVALSADGSIALIGVHHDDDNGLDSSGSVYVFTRSGSTWTEQQKLHASDPAVDDRFGRSVALSADSSLALVGAFGDDDNGLTSSGSVYVFTQSGGVWTEQQKLHASDGAVDDLFGVSVALSADGTLALIGAQYDDDNGLASSGSVYVFTRVGTVWTEQQKLHASDPAETDYFGASVALSADGSLALIGAHYDDDNGITNSGSVYVFTRVGTVWTEQQKLHASDPAEFDLFGRAVALSADGSLALIGAHVDDDNGLDNSGSVYVLT